MTILRPLGSGKIMVSPLGLGCWQFSQGQGLIGSYWANVDQGKANAIVEAAREGGVNWFDTAELYGKGRSEQVLAAALSASGARDGDVVVATKWNPLFRTARSIGTTIGTRQANLAPFSIDLHQVHQPLSFSSVESQMNAMADLVDAGAIRAVGVSNFSAAGMRRAHAALVKRGLTLGSNQMHYSLLHRNIERNGVMQAAKELGVTIIAYSPLAQGLLSGRFHEDPRQMKGLGMRRLAPGFRARNIERTRPLITALQEIGRGHGVSAAQIALAWLITFHGDTVTAIPGATSVAQARSNAAAMRVALSAAELSRLDVLSRDPRPR